MFQLSLPDNVDWQCVSHAQWVEALLATDPALQHFWIPQEGQRWRHFWILWVSLDLDEHAFGELISSTQGCPASPSRQSAHVSLTDPNVAHKVISAWAPEAFSL